MRPLNRRNMLVYALVVASIGVVVGVVSAAWQSSEVEAIVAGMAANDALFQSCEGTFTLEEHFSPKAMVSLSSSWEGPGRPAPIRTSILELAVSFPKVCVAWEEREGEGTEGPVMIGKRTRIWDGQRGYRIKEPSSPAMVIHRDSTEVFAQLNPVFLALYLLGKPRAEVFEDENTQVELVGYEMEDGRTLAVLELHFTAGPEAEIGTRSRWRIDIERGYLPADIETTYNPGQGGRLKISFGDYQQYGNLWLPLSAVLEIYYLDPEENVISTIETTELVVNCPVPAEAFSYELPPGAPIFDEELNYGYRAE